MFHNLSRRRREDRMIAAGLKVLRERIAEAKIPPSKLDETLNVATWNVREFGKKKRSRAAIHYIAEIFYQFDLVVLTELRDNLEDLKRVLDILGPYWRVVFSDFNTDWAGNWERIAFVYDKRMAVFTGLAAEADEPKEKDPVTGRYESKFTWWRSPYMASFSAGSFDFMLLAVHIRWGDGVSGRMPEVEGLARWMEARAGEKGVFDRDIIAVGDFNIPSKGSSLYKALTRRGWKMPGKILQATKGTNLEGEKLYDQILYNSKFTSLADPVGGALDFYKGDFSPLFPKEFFPEKSKKELTYELSDHLPLWIQLDTWTEDEVLDQVLRITPTG